MRKLSYYETKTLQRAKGILSCCGIKYAGRAWKIDDSSSMLNILLGKGTSQEAIQEALKRMEFAFRRVKCYNEETEWSVDGRMEKFPTITIQFEEARHARG